MVPNTTQAVDATNASAQSLDRLFLSVSAVIIILLAEAILTVGTCAVTRWALDAVSINFSRNVHVAVNAMNVVGAALIGLDFLLILGLMVRSLRRAKFQVSGRKTSTQFRASWNSRALAGQVR